jgi:phosphoribosylanthranilate isomerase
METDELIQVAGVIDQAEADLLVACGVRILGFPLRLPVHREDLTEDAAARIIRQLPPHCAGVLITYLDHARPIIELCRCLGARVVQLHGEIDAGELARIKVLEPQLAIIKGLVVGRHSPAELLRIVGESHDAVDAYITDTFDPATGACGATGKTHPWSISREIVLQSPRPVLLAGGLTPENVREAILTVRPAGVDAHTGLEEASGRKSREKVARFVAEARAAFRTLREGSIPPPRSEP